MKKTWQNRIANLALCCVVSFIWGTGQAGEFVIYDAEKTDATTIHATGEATFKQENGLLTILSHGGKINSGVAISGSWDLSQYTHLRIEGDTASRDNVMFSLIVQNGKPDWNKRTGYFVERIALNAETGLAQTLRIAPTDIEVHGMRRNPWQVGEVNSLDRAKVRQISLYVNRTKNDFSWTVKRIIALAPGEDTLHSWLDMTNQQAFPFIDIFGQFRHKEWPGKVYSDADLHDHFREEMADLKEHPGPVDWNDYGGWKDGPRFDASGQFRVQKIEGKWWLIDPEGCLWWSHGPVRVSPSCAETPIEGREMYFSHLPEADSTFARFYDTHDQLLRPYYIKWKCGRTFDFSSSNAMRKYGLDWFGVYSEMAHVRLKSWGMNTIANGSDQRICQLNRTPYSDRIELQSPPIAASSGLWWPLRDPYHPEFKTSFRRQLEERQEEIVSPWCFGFFVDNELNWGDPTSPARWTMESPATQPAKIVFVDRLKKKYESIKRLNTAWKTEFADWNALLNSTGKIPTAADDDLKKFSAELIDTYFKNIRDEFKKIAPNKLYLGCRFAGSNESVLFIAAQYCDIVSFNIYGLTADRVKLPQGVDKPVMIGEFHFGALDRGLLHDTLVGVPDQKARGEAYYHYVESALKHPNIVGVHWHQYGDQATSGRFDGECFQNGLVDVCDTPYSETIAKIREIGYKMYQKRWSKK